MNEIDYDNKDYHSIMNSMRVKCKLKDKEDWKSFKYEILEKAFRGYKKEFGAKFTSYLYTKTKYEIMKINQKLKKKHSKKEKLHQNLEFLPKPVNINIYDTLNSLSKESKNILIHKYIYNFSSTESAKILNITKSKYFKLLKNAKEEFKRVH